MAARMSRSNVVSMHGNTHVKGVSKHARNSAGGDEELGRAVSRRRLVMDCDGCKGAADSRLACRINVSSGPSTFAITALNVSSPLPKPLRTEASQFPANANGNTLARTPTSSNDAAVKASPISGAKGSTSSGSCGVAPATDPPATSMS